MPLLWQLHEAHENDRRKLYLDLGFVDRLRQLRRFEGAKFWPAWEALGHSKLTFESCSCRLQEDGKRAPPGETT